MTDADRFLDLIVNAAVDVGLWVLALLPLATVQAPRTRPILISFRSTPAPPPPRRAWIGVASLDDRQRRGPAGVLRRRGTLLAAWAAMIASRSKKNP